MKDLPMILICIGLFVALLFAFDRALDIEFPPEFINSTKSLAGAS